MKHYSRVILKPGKEEALRRFHPWIFSGAIRNITGPVSEGDSVTVHDARGEFLALGHYQPGTISVRILTFKEEDLNRDFWTRKLSDALKVRHACGLDNEKTNVFRLVNGEGDDLPGMVIDFYNGVAVFQFHSAGMYIMREEFASILREIFGDRLKAVFDKSSKTMSFKSGLRPQDGFIFGSSDAVTVLENGLAFRVDWINGQKTGFYIDQRENRQLLGYYAAGRDVLNLFSYTGGFTLYALRGGAGKVHSVDSSASAVTLEKENIGLNFPGETCHTGFITDVADFLKETSGRYDLIVIDPPAFSKHLDSLEKALQAYKNLNARAIGSINSGGILFTFSCSQVVSAPRFREAVFSGAALAGRKVRVIHRLSQPPDHPVNIFHPEGEYLKGLVLYVE